MVFIKIAEGFTTPVFTAYYETIVIKQCIFKVN